jgi:transposase-like protein
MPETGFIDCGAKCPHCSADPGCEKNIVHTDAKPGESHHRCRSCKKSWPN